MQSTSSIPGRYRILCWAAPAALAQWMAIVAIDPAGPGTFEYVSVGFVLGSLFGQATLAAAWAAIGPGPIAWRVPLSVAWVLILTAVLAANISINGGPDSAWVVIGLCLFGQWLLVQLPLWALAIGLGLRLQYLDEFMKIHAAHSRQFNLRHLMLVTAIVGVLFGAGRMLTSWFVDAFVRDHEAPVFIFLAVAAVILTLPLLLAGLLPRWSIPAVVAVLALIGLATAWELNLMQAIPGTAGPGPQTRHFVWINVFTALTILAGVLLLRLNGYGTVDSQNP